MVNLLAEFPLTDESPMRAIPARRTPLMPNGRVRSAVEALGSAIVGGEFPPLATLPNEDALSLRFGLSRLSLREAIKVLSGKGLVRTMRRYGSRVRAPSEWNHLDPDIVDWHLRDPANLPHFLRDLCEVRLLVEPVATALAAERARPDEIARIVALADRLPPVVTFESIATDVAFHAAVLRASDNLLIAGLAPAMEVLMPRYLVTMFALKDPSRKRESTLNLHQLTARAIAARDVVLARRYSEAMLEITADAIGEVIRSQAGPSPSNRLAIGRALKMFSATA
jgi:DNA-binding FadR family transcriptional regulator